jgi:hypothetical protein
MVLPIPHVNRERVKVKVKVNICFSNLGEAAPTTDEF